jgi:2-polyprenyl-6-methoxyphenol hydroxylase-like FAD-dependent oxidoreductase
MKVLISGAGIAGSSLAFWLSRLGHNVTVIERHSSLRTTGLQIDLRGHGVEVMKRMGLEEAFRAKAAPEQGVQMVDSSGRRRAFFPVNKSNKGPQSFTTEFEIMRADLCRLLYDATKDRVNYVFGTSIESFEETDGHLEVRFSDGKTDRFDLLVGADGQGSRTRKMMLGPDTADAFYPLGGLYIGYFTMPRPIQEGEEYIATVYIAPGRRGMMTRRHSPDEIQIYAGCRTDSERLKNARPGDVVEQKEALTEVLRGAGWQTEDILNSLKDAENFYCEHVGIVKMESWSRGRVALLGDAAYCPSANTGMGTSSAIVGAYVLAGEIGRHCGRSDGDAGRGGDTKDGLTTALKAYEDKFRPFMNQVQKGVLENSGLDTMPSGRFGIAIMNYLLGFASFLRLNIFAWSIQEPVKGWDLPDYEEMRKGVVSNAS